MTDADPHGSRVPAWPPSPPSRPSVRGSGDNRGTPRSRPRSRMARLGASANTLTWVTVSRFELAGQLYVDNVRSLKLAWDRTTAPTWEVSIGDDTAEEEPAARLMMVQGSYSHCFSNRE